MRRYIIVKMAIIAMMSLYYCSNVLGGALDQYYINSTTLIMYDIDNLSRTSGTGFFVFKEIDNNVGQVYLITNKHLIPSEGVKKEIKVRITANRDGKSVVYELPINIIGQDNLYLPSIRFHPNRDYDIVAIHVTQEINRNKITGIWIPYSLLATKSMMKEEEITIGSEILLLGYPDAIYDPRNVFPILRKGIIASVPVEGFNFNSSLRNKFKLPEHIDGFLVDANVYPGSSGSLVVLRQQPNPIGFRGAYSGRGPKNIPYVLGIISGSIPIDDLALRSRQRMGLGIVYSSEAIMATIDQFYK